MAKIDTSKIKSFFNNLTAEKKSKIWKVLKWVGIIGLIVGVIISLYMLFGTRIYKSIFASPDDKHTVELREDDGLVRTMKDILDTIGK